MWSCSAILFTLICFVHASGDYRLKVVNPDEVEPRSPATRIVGGQPTTIEQWPFVVQVLRNTVPGCGGSIITSRHVLSAAHCFFNMANELYPVSVLSVRAGSTTTFTGGTVVPVQDIIPHAEWNTPTYNNNDIAMLLLEHELTFSSSVQAVGIPEMGYTVPDDADVTYLGWGSTNEPGEESGKSPTLREVWVKKVNNAVCQQRYEDLEQLINPPGEPWPMHITSSMICAGSDIGGKGFCGGDSGGPVVYNGILVGVISFGYTCGDDPFYPDVSARVSSFTDWIADTMDQLSPEDTTAPEPTTEASETGDVENGGVSISIQNSAILSITSVLVMLVYCVLAIE